MSLPPAMRSHAARGLTAAAAEGRLDLQVCQSCKAVQYPPREACHVCLSTELRWQPQDGGGELLADTRIHVSQNEYFKERLPWRVALVRLDCGPTVLCHLHAQCPPPPARVRVQAHLDLSGQGVLIALPVEESADIVVDPKLLELTRTAVGAPNEAQP